MGPRICIRLCSEPSMWAFIICMQLDMEPELMHTAGMALSAASVMAAKAYEQGTANAAAAMRALPGPSSTSGGNSNTITAEATTVTVPSSPTKVPSVVVVPSTTATTEPAVPKERRDRDRDGGGGSGVSGGGSGVTSNVVAAAGMGATPVQQQQRGEGLCTAFTCTCMHACGMHTQRRTRCAAGHAC